MFWCSTSAYLSSCVLLSCFIFLTPIFSGLHMALLLFLFLDVLPLLIFLLVFSLSCLIFLTPIFSGSHIALLLFLFLDVLPLLKPFFYFFFLMFYLCLSFFLRFLYCVSSSWLPSFKVHTWPKSYFFFLMFYLCLSFFLRSPYRVSSSLLSSSLKLIIFREVSLSAFTSYFPHSHLLSGSLTVPFYNFFSKFYLTS